MFTLLLFPYLLLVEPLAEHCAVGVGLLLHILRGRLPQEGQRGAVQRSLLYRLRAQCLVRMLPNTAGPTTTLV
jgi:hypothetical protein